MVGKPIASIPRVPLRRVSRSVARVALCRITPKRSTSRDRVISKGSESGMGVHTNDGDRSPAASRVYVARRRFVPALCDSPSGCLWQCSNDPGVREETGAQGMDPPTKRVVGTTSPHHGHNLHNLGSRPDGCVDSERRELFVGTRAIPFSTTSGCADGCCDVDDDGVGEDGPSPHRMHNAYPVVPAKVMGFHCERRTQ